MRERGHGPADPDDGLRRRRSSVSEMPTTVPLKASPASHLPARRETRPRGRVALLSLAVLAFTVTAVIAGVAGGAIWPSFGSAGASSNAPVAGSGMSPTASRQGAPTSTAENASGPELAEHEHVRQMSRTSGGGWLLTRLRLRVFDGAGWRDCWSEPESGSMASPRAVMTGSAIWVNAEATLWTSRDGCATWTQTASPGPATGLAFPTESIGYLAYTDYGETNQARIYKTIDGGLHWAPAAGQVNSQGELSLAFADSQVGWLSDAETLWRTADGGSTWVRATLPVPSTVHGRPDVIGTPVVGADGTAAVVAKYDATPGMDGAPGQRVFYLTRDLGAHWVAASVVDDPGALGIAVVDPTTWVVFDPSTASFRTTADGGATWQAVAVREKWPYSRGPIAFANSRHGWMVVTEPNPPCLAGVQCDYLFGPPEHLAATDDGGTTWVELKP